MGKGYLLHPYSQGVLYLSMLRDLHNNSIVICKTGEAPLARRLSIQDSIFPARDFFVLYAQLGQPNHRQGVGFYLQNLFSVR